MISSASMNVAAHIGINSRAWSTIFAAVAWSIWQVRNKIIFDRVVFSEQDLWWRIRSNAKERYYNSLRG